MNITNLECEFNENPLSIDCAHPRLSWKLEKDKNSVQNYSLHQTAYRIIVSSTREKLHKDEGDLWDSGNTSSNHLNYVSYLGKKLKPRTICYWKVKIWDEKNTPSNWSKSAFWINGPQINNNWNDHSKWIGKYKKLSYKERFPISEELKDVNPHFRAVARKMHPDASEFENKYAKGLLFKRNFYLDQPISNIDFSILRISGLGYNESFINGNKVGDAVLDPGCTDYTKTIYYSSYEIASLFKEKENSIDVILGTGWYFASVPDLFGFEKAPWTSPPKLRAEIQIEFKDGHQQMIGTDETWLISDDGALLFNSVRGGEYYDARKKVYSFSHDRSQIYKVKSSLDEEENRWNNSMVVDEPKGELKSQLYPTIKMLRTIYPFKTDVLESQKILFHFPENISGWPKIKVKAEEGQKITIKCNEKLLKSGEIDLDTHSGHTFGEFQTHHYICAGDGIEEWQPMFSYQGFQFVQVEGIDLENILDLEAVVVHSAPKRIGKFKCSDKLINQIDKASRRTFLNGYHSYPEDCPQREKAGWTEDAAISAQGAIYNFDLKMLYEKWIKDLIDSQHDSGQIPDIVPTSGWGKPYYEPSDIYGKMADPWWGGAIIMMPWTLYLHYGDLNILKDTYPFMKKYMAFLNNNCDKDNIIRWESLLGDWLEVGSSGAANRTPTELTATQAFHYYCSIMKSCAEILSETNDIVFYSELAVSVKNGINRIFLDESNGSYCLDSQSAQSISLVSQIHPVSIENKVLDYLVNNIEETHDGHLSTGIVGTHFLYQALGMHDRADLAFDIITAKGFPGFEYMLNFNSKIHGPSTTLWEDWAGKSSLNHPVQGCVVGFFYEYLAGIRPLAKFPGYKKFLLNPQFIPQLNFVKCELNSPFGMIRSNWQRETNSIEWEVSIPINTSSYVVFPTSKIEDIEGLPDLTEDELDDSVLLEDEKTLLIELESGDYSFFIKK